MGIDFNRKYYCNGEMVYIPKKGIDLPCKKNEVNIITEIGSDIFRCIVISDLHIGSAYQNEDAWNKIIDYCVINNIHTIIIAGDFLDGINVGKPFCKIHNDPIKQIEYALKRYPSDNGILNYLILGNHDVDSLVSYGIDFATIINNYRHDIVAVGYGYGKINVKNEKIIVSHPLGIGINNDLDLGNNYLLLKGPHHRNRSIIGGTGNCSLTIPSLSNIFLTENEFLPGAIDLTIKFKDGFFETIYYDHLLISNNIYCVSSTQFSVSRSKDKKVEKSIKHEEIMPKKRQLTCSNK